MMIPFLLLGAVMIGALFLLGPRPVFVVLIRDGKATVRRGKVPGRLLVDWEELSRDSGIRNAKIRAYRRRRQVALRFSSGVPEEQRQKFRNVLGAHR